MEIFIIFVGAIITGVLVFIALTMNSISHDLFRIKQILNNHEQEQTESRKKEFVETGKITH